MNLDEQIQNTSHTHSTATSNPSTPPPVSPADRRLPSPTATISQGPPPSQTPLELRLREPSTSSSTGAQSVPQQHPRQSVSSFIFLHPNPKRPRSQSVNLHTVSKLSAFARAGKSETRLHSLLGNQPQTERSSSNPQLTMLATESNPTACFTLTSPLLPPSLANTSATAPPPSSTGSSRKKAKTRLTLSSLPRFPQPPSHSSQPSAAPGMASPINNHYTYSHQYSQHYGQQYSQAQQYSQQQSYLSAQQQLQLHQKDLIQQATRGSLPSHLLFPVSPRLIPMGSPGPVTPLTLEESQGGYLFAGSPSSSSSMPFLQQRELDKLSAIAATQN